MDNVPQYLNSKYFSSLSYVFGKYVEIASTNKKQEVLMISCLSLGFF